MPRTTIHKFVHEYSPSDRHVKENKCNTDTLKLKKLKLVKCNNTTPRNNFKKIKKNSDKVLEKNNNTVQDQVIQRGGVINPLSLIWDRVNISINIYSILTCSECLEFFSQANSKIIHELQKDSCNTVRRLYFAKAVLVLFLCQI